MNLYINARTDVYLAKLAPPEQAVEETIRRGRACKAAGASGLFAPFAMKAEDIAAIAEGVDMPLNIISWAGVPKASELKRLGARRLSAGTEIARVAPGDQAGYARFLDYAAGVYEQGYVKLGAKPFLNFSAMIKAAPALARYQAWRSAPPARK